MEWTEKQVESYMGREARKRDCLFYKFVSPGNEGVPDRILITPKGIVYFIELKINSAMRTLRNVQRLQISRLLAHKANVLIVCGKSGVDDFFRGLEADAL